MVALLVPVLVGAGFTPTGRAVGDRLGELVGIGDEPTSSSSMPIDFPDVVIGAGESPDGAPFEIVASSDMNLTQGPETTCVRVELPESSDPREAGSSCLTKDAARNLSRAHISPLATLGTHDLGSHRLIVHGLASTDVDRAEIVHEAPGGAETTFLAHVARLDAELAEQIEAEAEVGFLLAFLPAGLVPGIDAATAEVSRNSKQGDRFSRFRSRMLGPGGSSSAEAALHRISVVAYDASGSEIARTRLDSHPWAPLTLYSQVKESPEQEAKREASRRTYEQCLLEIAEGRGEDGRVKPDLPESVLREIEACARKRTGR